MARKQAEVREALGERAALVDRFAPLFDDAYWIAEPVDIIALNLRHHEAALAAQEALRVHCEAYPALGATLVTVIAEDIPGLFYRIVGGIHLAGANIIDARIHTTRDGWAVDNFLVQDPHGAPFMEDRQLARIRRMIADALANRVELTPRLARRPLPHRGSKVFEVSPRVEFDNKASNRFTVIEVNARDRPALLHRLAGVMFECGLEVHSAHVTNYGERAADTFYVTDAQGAKLLPGAVQDKVAARLAEAASDALQAKLEDA